MRLAARDLRNLLASAEAVATIDEPDHFASGVFAAIRRLISCDYVIYNDMDLRRRRSVVAGDPPGSIGAMNATWERFMDQHPVLVHATTTGDPSARAISEFLPRRAFRRLELYQEVYRGLGIDDQVGAMVRIGPTWAIGVSASRNGRTFDERERLLLDGLRPHVAHAYRRAHARARMRARMASLERGLDAAAAGVFELGPDKRVAFATPRAVSLLAKYGERATALSGRIDAWAASRNGTPLVLDGDDGHLVLRRVDGDATVVVAEERDPLSRRALRELGLTPREADILTRVALRKTNAEIAHELGISARTVAKHLERISSKLGVSGRRAAVAAATRERS